MPLSVPSAEADKLLEPFETSVLTMSTLTQHNVDVAPDDDAADVAALDLDKLLVG